MRRHPRSIHHRCRHTASGSNNGSPGNNFRSRAPLARSAASGGRSPNRVRSRSRSGLPMCHVRGLPVQIAVIETEFQRRLDYLEVRRDVEIAWDVEAVVADAQDFLDAIGAVAGGVGLYFD